MNKMKFEKWWMMGGGKRLLAGMWRFSGYISIKVSRRGNTTTAAMGKNLLPHRRCDCIYKGVPPTLFLFFYTQLTLIHRMSYIQFQFLVIVLTCHKSMHHAK